MLIYKEIQLLGTIFSVSFYGALFSQSVLNGRTNVVVGCKLGRRWNVWFSWLLLALPLQFITYLTNQKLIKCNNALILRVDINRWICSPIYLASLIQFIVPIGEWWWICTVWSSFSCSWYYGWATFFRHQLCLISCVHYHPEKWKVDRLCFPTSDDSPFTLASPRTQGCLGSSPVSGHPPSQDTLIPLVNISYYPRAMSP